MKILWQTKSEKLFALIKQSKVMEFYSGGNLYNFFVYKILSKKYTIYPSPISVKSKRQGIVKYFFKFSFSSINKSSFDLIISDPFSLVFNLFPDYESQVVILHHIEIFLAKTQIRYKIFNKILIYKLRKVKAIIVVSEFWYNFLIDCGVNKKNIKIIYNSYRVEDYVIENSILEAFKKKYHLDNQKPIVYIGVADPIKGVEKVYNALKDDGYLLVTTGSKNNAKNISPLFLSLNKDEYIHLLKVCDLVVVMSELAEGWSRVCHESLLSKTTVVGSGICGMYELLDKSDQYICQDINQLSRTVKKALLDEKSSIKGHNYIKKYNNNYFQKKWLDVVDYLEK